MSFPPRKPCDFPSLSIAFFLRFFKEKNVPTAVWLATGAFATENRGDSRLRFLVLSGWEWKTQTLLLLACFPLLERKTARFLLYDVFFSCHVAHHDNHPDESLIADMSVQIGDIEEKTSMILRWAYPVIQCMLSCPSLGSRGSVLLRRLDNLNVACQCKPIQTTVSSDPTLEN